ncbi:MAG: hypothetical protein PHI15_10090, partial [Methanomicrobium sp.]|nr:hypothetical protein [Methanomicrobium sp.]
NFTMIRMLNDNNVRKLIQTNSYKNILWFRKESFEDFLFYMMVIAVIDILKDTVITESERVEEITECYSVIIDFLLIAEQSGYQLEKFLAICKSS